MNRWESYAKKNAEYYILTNDKVDYSTPEGQAYFFKTGEEFTRYSLDKVEKYLQARGRALEIGCGIGRLTFPHSYLFEEIHAVDISMTMLTKLNKLATERSVYNIKTFLSDDAWDQPEIFNYAYSFIVFQHIESFRIIEDYIQKIARSLKLSGIAQLQFDTRHQSLPYKIRNIIPEFLLPRTYRKGVRRIRRNPEVLRNLFMKFGLHIIKEENANTENHTFFLKKR